MFCVTSTPKGQRSTQSPHSMQSGALAARAAYSDSTVSVPTVTSRDIGAPPPAEVVDALGTRPRLPGPGILPVLEHCCDVHCVDCRYQISEAARTPRLFGMGGHAVPKARMRVLLPGILSSTRRGAAPELPARLDSHLEGAVSLRTQVSRGELVGRFGGLCVASRQEIVLNALNAMSNSIRTNRTTVNAM